MPSKKGNLSAIIESFENTAPNEQLKELHGKISKSAYNTEQTISSLNNMQKEMKSKFSK